MKLSELNVYVFGVIKERKIKYVYEGLPSGGENINDISHM